MLLEHDPRSTRAKEHLVNGAGPDDLVGGALDRSIAIIDALLVAGAQLPDKHVPVNPRLDAFLASKR
jgi:hypothetical protein